MAKKSPTEDKSVRHAFDKAARLTNDQAQLERDANIDGPSSGGDHKRSQCFNPACPDYRVERVGDGPCSCKRTTASSR